MILLAAHLNIPLELMVVPENHVAEKYPKPKLSKEQMDIFKRLNKMDYMLYNRFVKVLNDKIDAFGRDRYVLQKN